MKLNERSLAFYATCDTPADNEGFLYKKGGRHAAYHRRWFVLRGNMLFYFEDAASREPVGVIILEGCTVELVEAAEEFAFAVRFAGARARTYVLAAESQAAMEGWVKALSRASFDYLRLVVRELERQLEAVRSGGAAPPRRPRALPPKENGCAVWSAEPPAAAAAAAATAPAPAGATPGSQPGPEPPPLPPRRRASAPNGPLDSASFAQLHEWRCLGHVPKEDLNIPGAGQSGEDCLPEQYLGDTVCVQKEYSEKLLGVGGESLKEGKLARSYGFAAQRLSTLND